MNILIENKKHRVIAFLIGISIIIILIAAFVIRYNMVNKNVKKTIENTLYFGSEYINNNNISYTIGEPKIAKEYDTDYETDVYRYYFPLYIENRSSDMVSVYDIIPGFCVFSGGDVWYGDISGEDDVQIDIESKESASYSLIIDVIPNKELKEKIYEEYEFYNVITDGDQIYKLKYSLT